MSRRMIVVCLAAFCAVAMSAIAASGASAGATAFTCVKEGAAGPSKFSDEHCKTVENTKGAWGHEKFGEATELKLASIGGTIMEADMGGVGYEISISSFECVGCVIENKEVEEVNEKGETVKAMEATGSGGTLTFNGVTIPGLQTKCEIVGAKSDHFATKPLRFTTKTATGLTLEPLSGTVFAEFSIKSKPGQVCGIATNGLQIKGKAATTLTGATMKINVTRTSKELMELSAPFSFKGEATVSAGKAGSGTFHPIALTATTP